MIKAMLNMLNGWQRIFLLLSVCWACVVCFSEIIMENQIKSFSSIEKPSIRLKNKAGHKYPEYVREQAYEQYLLIHREEFEAYLMDEIEEALDLTPSGRLLECLSTPYYNSFLPEYRSMERFLIKKGLSVGKGLSLRIEAKDDSEILYELRYYGIQTYNLMRKEFPELSEGFDTIDSALEEEFQFKLAYAKELAYNYLLSPLKIIAVVFLPTIAMYLLLLAAVRTVNWVIAGFAK